MQLQYQTSGVFLDIPVSGFCMQQHWMINTGLYKESSLELIAGVEKVSEPGNLVPRNFFELRVLQKIFQKIFQHFEITLFTQLTSYNYSTLFTLYTLTSAAF